MIERMFDAATAGLSGSLETALAAAFGWGILSIMLSPCHLSGIPLIIGFISGREQVTVRRSFTLSSLFAIGVLITIASIGVLTASMGRLMGDVGFSGRLIVSAVFVGIGVHMMGAGRLPWSGPPLHTQRRGAGAALVLGLLFGIGLGPCTFAFVAPVLGVVFQTSQTSLLKSCALLLMFGIGHVTVIVLAGTFARVVQTYLDWSTESTLVPRIRRICGLLVVAGGVYLATQTIWP